LEPQFNQEKYFPLAFMLPRVKEGECFEGGGEKISISKIIYIYMTYLLLGVLSLSFGYNLG